MKLLTVAAGTLLLAAAFATPGQAAPIAPGIDVLTGTTTQPTTEVRWQGRRMMRGHHYGWNRGRHMGWRHSRRWR